MTTEELLDAVEGLFLLDPVRSYPERGAAIVARVAGAVEHRFDASGGNGAGGDPGPGWLAVPLRNGKGHVGVVQLRFESEADAAHPERARAARWAAKVMARGMAYAERLSSDSERRTGEDVREAVARAPLTPRERDVVTLLVSGASTRDIANQIGLTVATVNTYLKRIFSKLGVHSRVELVARMAGTGALVRYEEAAPQAAAANA